MRAAFLCCLLAACSGDINRLNSEATSNSYGSDSCVGDPDRPLTCTYWTCQNVPTQYGTKTHCTAPSPPNAPGGEYTCPGSGGGLQCPGPNAGGNGDWQCTNSGGLLSCDRGGGGSGWTCTSSGGIETCTNPDCQISPSGEFGCTGSGGVPPGSPPGGWNCSLQGGVYTCTSGGGSGFGGCTLTQGYWKNHPQAWPQTSLTIGGVTYTQQELLTILRTAPGGDASLILAHQLIAAMLNQLNGAGMPPAITQAINDAQAWMAANKGTNAGLPYGISASSAAGAQAVALSETLDQFNNGLAGPPHCN